MNFKTWLWPDRTIGKRESRQLREEHNALVNHCEDLREALEQFATCNLNEDNCASFEVANRRIRTIAKRALDKTA